MSLVLVEHTLRDTNNIHVGNNSINTNSHIKYGEPRPISENMVNRYLGMFSTALNNAVRQGIIRNNR